jgi:hydroxyacylglutathione hydrolase
MAGDAVIVAEAEGIWRITAGVFASNCYAVATSSPGGCALIDPGLGGIEIHAELVRLGLRPHAVLCTHGHFDHGGSAALFQREYGCPVFLHSQDVKTLKASNFLLMAFKIEARVEQPEVDVIDAARAVVEVDGCQFEFVHAPGHTPGSCAISFGTHLFTGDTLYARGVGLSKLPGEKTDQLRASLSRLLADFPADTSIHPGHAESASLGWISHNNHALRRFLSSPAYTSSDQ